MSYAVHGINVTAVESIERELKSTGENEKVGKYGLNSINIYLAKRYYFLLRTICWAFNDDLKVKS